MTDTLANHRLDFALPPALEASEPIEYRGLPRDAVRLLVSDRGGVAVHHARFVALASLLRPGDLLVANDSATLPAALDALRPGGAPLTVHLSTKVSGTLWTVEPRGSVEEGEALRLPAGASIRVLIPTRPEQRRMWYARFETIEPVAEYLYEFARPIRYGYVEREFPIEAYQTIFARVSGSVEMPSAGRPFTERALASLEQRGITLAMLTLHCGVASAEGHEPPQNEWFSVSAATARVVNEARHDGRRVIAIGTTVVRALESSVRDSEVVAASGWTDLIVTPERGVQVTNGLLTGLHEPAASHIAMLRAFLDEPALGNAYREALSAGYRWHEFGDVHLIL